MPRHPGDHRDDVKGEKPVNVIGQRIADAHPFRSAPQSRSAGISRDRCGLFRRSSQVPADQGFAHQLREPRDKSRRPCPPWRRGDNPARRHRVASFAIFDIQLHQGLGMFADKSDGRQDQSLAFRAGAADLACRWKAPAIRAAQPGFDSRRSSPVIFIPSASTRARAVCSTCH